MRLCRRKTDGAIFRPSFPDGYTQKDAFTDMMRGQMRFYFQGVRWEPRKWWQMRGRWVDTGEVWEPESGEFDVSDAQGNFESTGHA